VRIFLAGASGVLGVRLVPLLVAKGHAVHASRSTRPLGGRRLSSTHRRGSSRSSRPMS